MKHELLTFTMNEAWKYLHNLLVGITDQEFFLGTGAQLLADLSNGEWELDL